MEVKLELDEKFIEIKISLAVHISIYQCKKSKDFNPSAKLSFPLISLPKLITFQNKSFQAEAQLSICREMMGLCNTIR